MASLLHIHRGKRASGIAELLSDVEIVDARPDDAFPVADVAVIGADVENPLRVARAVHQASPQAHIVFLTDEATEGRVRRELLVAPRIGRHWSLTRDSGESATEAVRNALQSATQRRLHRTTIGRINMRLVEHAPAARAVVSDHFFATVLEQLSDGVVMVGADGRVLAANDAATQMFGSRLLRGAPFDSVLPPGGEQLAELIGGVDDDLTSELTLANGEESRIVEVRVTKVRNELREPAGTAILARDVTQRRLAERRQHLVADASVTLSSTLELDAAMQRLAEFVAATLDATVGIDIFENETFTRRGAAAGGRPDLTATLRRYAPGNEEHPGREAFREGRYIVRNDCDEETIRRLAVDDSHLDLIHSLGVRSFAAFPLFAGTQLIGSFALGRALPFRKPDVDLLRELAEVTARSVQNIWLYHAAEQANRAKEEFLATLSHELRTPMTSVLGWIQMLRDDTLEPQLFREGLQAMEQSARVQAQLIDDLLDLSRIEMGKLHLQMQTVDLCHLVRAAVDTIRPSAGVKNIRLDVDTGNEMFVIGDPNRLQQVVWNLLSNAVKFTERGGTVKVTARREGADVSLSVADNGRGIEPEFLPHVFDRFRQSESTATRRYGGLGLGLAIVRQIVDLHGGAVSARSEGLGHGATFTVCLPVGALRVGDPEESNLVAEVQATLEGISVLLVEDDASSAVMLRTALALAGAKVRCERSVSAALEALRDEIPDVLVSDLAMPEEDGFELIRQVRSTLRIPVERLPAIALSAFSDMPTRVRVLGAGFQQFLQKPVDLDVLAAAVASIAVPRRRDREARSHQSSG
ncbi:MAG TPA: ATP-binding protein [Thermoanaerobaculia bacterium]|nr:ATP-binding protein [Thermoanaerobaculia bacterium]